MKKKLRLRRKSIREFSLINRRKRWPIRSRTRSFSASESSRSITTWRRRFLATIFATVSFKLQPNKEDDAYTHAVSVALEKALKLKGKTGSYAIEHPDKSQAIILMMLLVLLVFSCYNS
ncbi:hypothetical protein Q3G72_006569 [Acer saccharum]|nr:hypothetical protein Q3G72_006569 [Acer saccharum]